MNGSYIRESWLKCFGTGQTLATPISAHDPSFDFESPITLSIEREMSGYLDGREIGRGLFSDSPLTTPEPTPPTQKPIFWMATIPCLSPRIPSLCQGKPLQPQLVGLKMRVRSMAATSNGAMQSGSVTGLSSGRSVRLECILTKFAPPPTRNCIIHT